MHLPGARPETVAVGATDLVIVNGAALLRGWAFQENTGTDPATLEIWDGTGTNGLLVAPISLKAGQSTRDYLPGAGIEIRVGVFFTVTAGELFGSLWVSPGEFVDNFVLVKGPIPFP